MQLNKYQLYLGFMVFFVLPDVVALMSHTVIRHGRWRKWEGWGDVFTQPEILRENALPSPLQRCVTLIDIIHPNFLRFTNILKLK